MNNQLHFDARRTHQPPPLPQAAAASNADIYSAIRRRPTTAVNSPNKMGLPATGGRFESPTRAAARPASASATASHRPRSPPKSPQSHHPHHISHLPLHLPHLEALLSHPRVGPALVSVRRVFVFAAAAEAAGSGEGVIMES